MSLLVKSTIYSFLDKLPTDKEWLQNEMLHAIKSQNINQFKNFVHQYREFGDIDDVQTDNGSTILMLAACEGFLEGVEFLLSCSASLTKVDECGCSVAHYAAYSKNKELIDSLKKAGADFGQISIFGCTPQLTARQINNLDIAKYLKETDTLAQAYSREFLSRKRIAHILEIKANTTLAHPSRQRLDRVSHNLEGWHPTDFWNTFAKRAKAFFESLPKEEIPAGINSKEVVEFCLEAAKNKPLEQLKRFSEQNKPISMNSGYKEHHSVVLLWGSFAVICDRAFSDSGFSVFQTDPKKIDAAFVTKITQMKSQDKKTYLFNALKEFDYCRVPNHPLSTHLNMNLRLNKQSMGNCTWANSEAAIYALFVLQSTKHYARSSMTVEEICKTQKTLLDKLRAFIIRYDADKYLTRHLNEKPRNKPYYPPEAAFLRLMKPNLPKDLARKVDKLLS